MIPTVARGCFLPAPGVRYWSRTLRWLKYSLNSCTRLRKCSSSIALDYCCCWLTDDFGRDYCFELSAERFLALKFREDEILNDYLLYRSRSKFFVGSCLLLTTKSSGSQPAVGSAISSA